MLTQQETPPLLEKVPNIGQAQPVVPMNIPKPEVNQGTALGNNKVPVRGIVAALNKYDADDDSDFKTWYFDDENIIDLNPFVGVDPESDFLGINFKKIGSALGKAGRFAIGKLGSGAKSYVTHFVPFGQDIWNKFDRDFTGDGGYLDSYMGVTMSEVSPTIRAILQKAADSNVLHVPTRINANIWYRDYLQETDSSFNGDEYNDLDGIDLEDLQRHQSFYDGLSEREQDVYSNFLGINFKKIGQAIGKAVKGVGKGIGAAGKLVGKVGKGIGKGALAVGKLGVKAVKGAARIAGAVSGLGDIFGGATNDQSNGVTLPANWGAGAGTVYSGANPDFDPQLYAPGEYEPVTGDADLYGSQIDDLADQGYTPTQDELANGAAPVYIPEKPKTNWLLWAALVAAIGLGFYLLHTKKIKI